MTATNPISSARSTTGCLILFFSVFALAGSSIFSLWFVPAAYHVIQARNWQSVPCHIITSKLIVRSGKSGKSSSYEIAVTYRYMVGERHYQSNRYQFLSGSSSGDRSGRQAIVNHLRPGSTATCFVNPNHPDQAVINRSWTDDMWFTMLFSLMFMAVGFLSPFFILKNRGRTKLAIPAEPESRSGEVILKPRVGPVGQLLGIIAVALFWNGILSVFVHEFLQSWHNQPEYWLGFFLIPFVCVGIAMIVGIVSKFLTLFNPRPVLRLAADCLTPGATTELRWSMAGQYDRIGLLRMTVEAREEATHQAGKSSQTDTNVFYKAVIFESTRAQEIAQGKLKLAIPPDTMHTFTAANNKIIWKIQLKAEVAGWPDVNEDFPLTVRPIATKPS